MKTIIVLLFFVVIATIPVFACVGARPLGMGGAFVAVADDINSVYWNPAGLANIKNKVLSLTLDTDKYDDGTFKSTYPYFFAAASGGEDGCWALSYIKVSEDEENPYRGKALLYAAYGKSISDRLLFGFEAGVRDVNDPSFDLSVSPESYVAHVPIFYALGWQYKLDHNINIGLLIQAPFNLRPGISIKPYDNLTLSCDIYDAFNIMGVNNLVLLGMEYKLNENLALRIGKYWGLTLGVGCKYEWLSVDWFSWQDEDNSQQMFHQGVAVTINF